ncbi:MAG: Ig-like domain-containing protein [Clostridia bacterium]|nr:Ig-like domain-containing protein [Clostridia bacterium]
MTKKFISLVLSLALVIGLLPTMGISVSAAGGTTYLVDDFQNYDVGVYSSGDSPLKVGNVSKWAINSSVKVEVVNMSDANGNSTKALKYINQAGGSTNITNNIYRLVAQKDPGHSTALADLKGNIFVQEVDMWFPSNIENQDGTTDIKRPYKASLGYGAAIFSDKLYIGGSTFSTGVTIEDETWYNVKTTFDFSEYTADGDPITYTVYVNDEAVYHKTYTSNYIKPSKNMGYFIISSSKRVSSVTDASGDFNDIYFIMDNLKMYTNPDKTVASSVYSDAANVSTKVSPVVNFTEKLFDTTIHSDGIISKDNIEFYKTADSSATVEINDPVVSADDKSITIDPVGELEGGIEYTVVVKNLKDMYGRDIPTATFNFTTSEPSSISVSQPVFTKENLFAAGGASQTITALENGYIKASATVSNSANTAKDVMVLSMVKEGEDIKYFQFDNITVPANGSAVFTGGFQIDNASTQKIETVVWDNITNKTPLADKYAFSASGYVKTDLDTLLGE